MEYIGSIKNGYMFTNNRKQVEAMQQALSNNETVEIYHYNKKGFKEYYYSLDAKGKIIVDDKKFNCYTKREKYYNTHIRGAYGVFPKVYQGTGKITAKHRVVEVYDGDNLSLDIRTNIISYNFMEITKSHPLYSYVLFMEKDTEKRINEFVTSKKKHMEDGNNGRWIIKLELIEEVDMELSDFVSWRKSHKVFKKQMEDGESFGNSIFCKQKEYRKLHNGIGYYGCKLLKDYEADCDYTNCPLCKLTKYCGLTRVIHLGGE